METVSERLLDLLDATSPENVPLHDFRFTYVVIQYRRRHKVTSADDDEKM